MEYNYRPGKHYDILRNYEFRRHLPYDYKNEGVVKKMMSPVVYNTQNKTTKMLVDFLEIFAQFFINYVDDLKHFKNYNHKLY